VATTPKSVMNDMEESTVRLLIDDTNSSKEVQLELNNILQYISQAETESPTTMENVKIVHDL
jgi:hypothetical protein